MKLTTWPQVLGVLERHPNQTVLRLPRFWLPHPEDAGARRSVGMPFGQQADYRFVLSDCRGLHVRQFADRYEAHIDRVDPQCSVVDHLREDAPNAYVAGAAALGALAGLLLGRSKEAALAGAGLGAVVGKLTSKQSGNDR